MWVRSEYAGELAVLFTWASALIPWSVSLNAQDAFTFVVVRFPLFAFQFLYGVQIQGAEVPFLPVHQAPAFPQSPTVVDAYTIWLAGGVVYLVAFLLSLGYYARDEQLEAALHDRGGAWGDPVRLLGGLLALAGVILGVSMVLLWRAYAGLSFPLGWLFMLGFGIVLLRVERTEAPDATPS